MSRIIERTRRIGYRAGSRGCCMSRIVCRTSRISFRSYSIGYRMSMIVESMSRTGLQDRQQRLLHEQDSLQD